MSIYRLDNPIINNAWGSPTAMTELYGYNNSGNKPMAELWMGAHPKAPSMIAVSDQENVALNEYIATTPESVLGEQCSQQFEQQLPFLFKVLSAATPLSIQSHPNKQQAIEGWTKENAQGIALDAPHRNYKDDNHKPELVYAITEFHALNGFRDYQQTIDLFADIKGAKLSPIVERLIQSPTSQGLRDFYHALMTYPQPQQLVEEALHRVEGLMQTHGEQHPNFPIWQLALELNQEYPGDIGVLSPFLIHYVVLKPGEAMFLTAGTLHAYLKGTALELMANSDNVLRGGLTPKHIDIDELFYTTVFEPKSQHDLLLAPSYISTSNEATYLTPARDFEFSVIDVTNKPCQCHIHSAEIVFVIEGEITLSNEQGSTLTLNKGQSAFIEAASLSYELAGNGKIARASMPKATTN